MSKGAFVKHTNPYLKPSAIKHFWERVEKSDDGCWIWTGASSGRGYGHIRSDWTQLLAHKFSYFLHYGPIPEGHVVRHKCDNPGCVRPDHLVAGTQKDNIADMDQKHRRNPVKGERSNLAKISDATAKDIMAALVLGRQTQAAIARRFGVSDGLVCMMKQGKRRAT